MNYSEKTNNLVTSLINNYCEYDDLSESYEININDIDSEDLYKLCAFIMQDNPDCAIEATGLDNPAYEEIMLPNLIHCLENCTNTFEHFWKKGILSYFHDRIIGLLENSLEIYNQDMAA